MTQLTAASPPPTWQSMVMDTMEPQCEYLEHYNYDFKVGWFMIG